MVPPSEREIIDTEQLRLLSIFHYVLGGMHVFFSCFLIIHFVLGLVMATAPHVLGERGGGPPTWFGLLMSLFAGCAMLAGWLVGGLTIYSGVCIKRRRYRTFSLVMAVLNCLSIPFGTALGIFTGIVLLRPSVMKLYAEQALPSTAPV